MKDRNKVAVSYLELGMLFFLFFFSKSELEQQNKKKYLQLEFVNFQ